MQGAVQRTRRKPEQAKEVGAEFVPFEELLRRSDFVLPQVPYSPATHHLFNAAVFAQMKPTAVFVNTTRGGVVDQMALYDALRAGRLFAAGLDVTDPEPLPVEHPLHSLANCLILPHVGTATRQCRIETGEETVRNLMEALTKERKGERGCIATMLKHFGMHSATLNIVAR